MRLLQAGRTFAFKTSIFTSVIALALFLASPGSFANPGNPPSLKIDLVTSDPVAYEKALEKMRTELTGSVPKKFKIDGIEYTGNYYRSGGQTDLFKVYEEGKPALIRVPQNEKAFLHRDNFVQIMKKLAARGIPCIKVLAEPNALTGVTKVEFLDDFDTMNDVLERAARNPNDPKVRAQITAVKRYVKKHGKTIFNDLKADNIGVGMKNGEYTMQVVDAIDDSRNFIQAEKKYQSRFFQMIEDKKDLYRSRYEDVSVPKGMTEAEFRKTAIANLDALEIEIMSQAYPSQYPRQKIVKSSAALQSRARALAKAKTMAQTQMALREEAAACKVERGSQMKLGISRTMGAAGNALYGAGLIMAVVLPETNPYAGDAIGVPCGDAYALRGRAKCEWDSPLNPFSKTVNCSVITEVQKIGKTSFELRTMRDEEVCRITYDSFGFDADDEAARDQLRAWGLFEKRGAKMQAANAQELLKNIQKKAKVTDVYFRENQKVPEASLGDII